MAFPRPLVGGCGAEGLGVSAGLEGASVGKEGMACSSLTANFVQNLRGRSVFLCLFFMALSRYDSGVIIFTVSKYIVH